MVVFEQGTITKENIGNKTNYKKIETLCKKVNELSDKGVIFDIFYNKIKLKQFVGSIKEGDTYLEILPKIYNNDTIEEGRKTLIKLLINYIGVNPKIIKNLNINFQTDTFIDAFIQIFINEVEEIVKKGLKKRYKQVEENNRVLKGRLLIPKQLRRNLFRKDRFFIKYEQFSIDIPENIIIKTALSFILKKTYNKNIRRKIKNLLFILDDISISHNPVDLLKKIHLDRTTSYYETAIKFSKFFLKKKSPSIVKEEVIEDDFQAILFDMNELFESYVAYVLKEKYKFILQTQKRGTFLAKHNGKNIFELKPDIFINLKNKICILDTKWKKLDETNRKDKFGISQADMYQMLAYATIFKKKYNKDVEIYLIYPKYEKFKKTLEFEISLPDGIYKFYAVPFSLKNDEILLKNFCK